MINFHESQKKILEPKNINEIVNASAGSGKTTVMIQKIADILSSGNCSMNELLVVTFTKLAAQEMKVKLDAKLHELANTQPDAEKYLQMLDELSLANIGTIHAYCFKLIKKYFYVLNLGTNVSIASETYRSYLVNLALKQTYTHYLATPLLYELIDIFGKSKRDMSALNESLLRTLEYYTTQVEGEKCLDGIIEEYNKTENISTEYIRAYLIRTIFTYRDCINTHDYQFGNNKKLNELLSIAKNLTNCVQPEMTLAEVSRFCSNIRELNFLGVKATDDIRQDYIDFSESTKVCTEILKKFTILDNLDAVVEINNKAALSLHNYIEYFKTFLDNFTTLKFKKNVLDFSDLELYTNKLLDNEEIRNEIATKIKYVFVDEFQDVNIIQSNILKRLSNGKNLFVVGDVKQSIYGFRQASPEQFVDIYERYLSTPSLGVANNMNINYRSNPKILQFINDIFSNIMTKKEFNKSSIDYASSSKFDPQRKDFLNQNVVEINVLNKEKLQDNVLQNAPIYSVKSHINNNNSAKDDTILNDKIISKIENLIGTEIYDSKTLQNRKIEYNDICILSRDFNSSATSSLVGALIERNIPITVEKSIVIKQSESIRYLIDILKVVNFSTDDVCWISFLTSSIAGLEYDELMDISSDGKDSFFTRIMKSNIPHVTDALSKLADIRTDIVNKNIKQTIEYLLYTRGLYMDIISLKAGKGQMEILQQFIASITDEESSSSLSEYLEFLSITETRSTKATISTGTNSVVVQTIHNSKGLEYPIVFLTNAGKAYNTSSLRSEVILCSELKIAGIYAYDTVTRQKFMTLPRLACQIATTIKENEEEKRLLYVALTRAQNNLYIYGTCSENSVSKLENNSYISSILSVYTPAVWSESQQFNNASVNFLDSTLTIRDTTKQSDENYKPFNLDINRIVEWKYPHNERTKIAKKSSVTELTHQLQEDYNILPKLLYREENTTIPTLETADTGTLYHKALQDLDFDNADVQKFDNSKVLDPTKLNIAYSTIKSLISKNSIVKKEAQFMLNVPYNEIIKKSNIKNKILVQGVIDLLIIDDDGIIIVDYKLSHAPADKLKSRYAVQLELYSIAAARAYNKPIKASYIYSINSGSLILMD